MTDEKRILERLLDALEPATSTGAVEVRRLIRLALVDIEHEAARSASGAEFSELHTTRVHVAPAPAETTRIQNPRMTEADIPRLMELARTIPLDDPGPQPVSEPARAAGDGEKGQSKDTTPGDTPGTSSPVPTPPDAAQGKPTDNGLTENEAANVLHKFRHAHSGSATTGESGLREEDRAVLVAAKCLSILWTTNGVSPADDEFLTAVENLHRATCAAWGIDYRRGFKMNTRSTPRAREGDEKLTDLIDRLTEYASLQANERDVYDRNLGLACAEAAEALSAIAGRRVGTEGDAT